VDPLLARAGGIDPDKDMGTSASWCRETLYPDVIESASPFGGPSVTIKTHHNVGGLRPNLPWKLIEPLRELFKDEVRQVGREARPARRDRGPASVPRPRARDPGAGPVDRGTPRSAAARGCDLHRGNSCAGLYDEIWQAFAVLLPIKVSGGNGDFRTYDHVVALGR